jgi:hypothetical protein
MPNWIELSVEDLNAYQVAELVTALREEALAEGQGDPFDEIFPDVASHIRRKIAAGGFTLDRNQAKIPKGLKAIACRRVVAAMKGRLGQALSKDESRDLTADEADLNRIADGKDPVDAPDNPDTTGAEIPPGTPSPQISARPRQWTRCNQDGI